MEQFDVQFYEGENEARAWINNCVLDIRPPHGEVLTKSWIGGTLSLFGCQVNKRWQRTDWGWQAKFTVGDRQATS